MAAQSQRGGWNMALMAVAVLLGVGGALYLMGVFDRPTAEPGPGGRTPATTEGLRAPNREVQTGSSEAPPKPDGVQSVPFTPRRDDQGAEVALGNEGPTCEGAVLGPDGGPLAGAVVELILDLSNLRGRSQDGPTLARVKTEPNGLFRFTGLNAHLSYIVQASHSQFTTERVFPVEAQAPETLNQTIKLEAGLSIEGTVKDQAGNPIEGASVSATSTTAQVPDGNPPPERIGTTGADGRYTIAHLKPGLKKVVARKSGLASEGKNGINVLPGQPAPVVDITLVSGFTLSGTVIDVETSAPLPGAVVQARFLSGLVRVAPTPDELPPNPDSAAEEENEDVQARREKAAREAAALAGLPKVEMPGRVPHMMDPGMRTFLVETATCDEAGRFEIHGLSEARYQLTVSVRGYQTMPGLTADAGSRDVVVKLKRSARIRGTAVDSNSGQPVSEFVLGLSAAPHQAPLPQSGRQEFRGSSGEFEFLDARPGVWFLVLEAPGYAGGQSVSITIQEGQGLSGIAVEAVRGARVHGRVLDKKNGGAAGARVSLLPGNRGAPSAADPFTEIISRQMKGNSRMRVMADADGRFDFRNVMPGNYRAKVEHPDYAESTSEAFDIADGGEFRVADLAVSAGGRVFGFVKKPDGTPDDKATVVVASAEPGFMFSMTRQTDSKGRYEVKGLKPGSYRVQATQLNGEFSFERIMKMQQGGTTYSLGEGDSVQVDF